MRFITYQQYTEYLKNNNTMKLKEKEATYKISRREKKNIYNEKRIQEVDKRHDKMFRNILSRKKEMANFLNQFLNLREKIEEKQIIQFVIYTGFQKWNAKKNFADRQYQSTNYKEYEINLEYNLIAVQDYTYEELQKKQTLFASIMIMEKCNDTEELIIQIDRIIEMIKEPKDRETLAEIIINVIAFRVGAEKANEMLEKINRREETGMSPLTKMLLDLEYKNWKKGVREGEGKRNYESSKKYVTIWRIRRKNYEIYRY